MATHFDKSRYYQNSPEGFEIGKFGCCAAINKTQGNTFHLSDLDKQPAPFLLDLFQDLSIWRLRVEQRGSAGKEECKYCLGYYFHSHDP